MRPFRPFTALDAVPEQPLNRLVVLDEFGAFIARDRLARLIALYRDFGFVWAPELDHSTKPHVHSWAFRLVLADRP